MLLRISTKTFVAGIEFDHNNKVTHCAPILYRYRRETLYNFINSAKFRKFKIEVLD